MKVFETVNKMFLNCLHAVLFFIMEKNLPLSFDCSLSSGTWISHDDTMGVVTYQKLATSLQLAWSTLKEKYLV